MFIFYLYLYVCLYLCILCVLSACCGQKRLSESLESDLQAIMRCLTWCWELNSDLLEEQQVHLTVELSLQFHPYKIF